LQIDYFANTGVNHGAQPLWPLPVFSGTSQQNFAGAGCLLVRLLPENLRQKNVRHARNFLSREPDRQITAINIL
jgi:hypothetical protein